MQNNGMTHNTGANAQTVATAADSAGPAFTDVAAGTLLSALPQSVVMRLAQPLVEKLLEMHPEAESAIVSAVDGVLGAVALDASDAGAATPSEQISLEDALAAVLRNLFAGFGDDLPLVGAVGDDGGAVAPGLVDAIKAAIRGALDMPAEGPGAATPDAAAAPQLEAQLIDLSELGLEQLMDLDVRGSARSIFGVDGEAPNAPMSVMPSPFGPLLAPGARPLGFDAAVSPTPGGRGADQSPNADLPPDLTAIGLQELLGLSLLSTGSTALADDDLDDLPEDLTALSLPTLMTIPLSGGGSAVGEPTIQVAALPQTAPQITTDLPGSGADFAAFGAGPQLPGLPATQSPVVDDAPGAGRSNNGQSNGNGQGSGQGGGGQGAGQGGGQSNAAPTSNAAAANGAENAASITVTVTGGDTDGTVQSFALTNLPANGTLYTDAGFTVAAAIGVDYAATAEALTLYFVPTGGWSDVTTFDFVATDNDGLADASDATATITVSAANGAPHAETDGVATAVNTAIIIAVMDNDSDPDSDPLTVQSVTQGANGAVVVNGDGTVTYTPNAAYTGADSFTYTIDDGQGRTDTATVHVAVGVAIEGTGAGEVINALAGDDVVFGYGGDDTLHGQGGDDILFGGDGDDNLNGNNGADMLFGGDGTDDLRGVNDDDLLDGGAGADALRGGNGDDTLVWDGADTSILGEGGDDTLRVTSGDADLTAFAGTISGIENVDLQADGTDHTLTLTVQDVLDMSDTDILAVLGDAGDHVDAGTGWTDAGIDGSGNQVYTQVVGVDLATLVLDPNLTTNADITS